MNDTVMLDEILDDTRFNERFHPLANIYPLATPDEIERMAKDIEEHGLLNGIVTFEGKILDGRNRYIACRLAGVPPHYRAWDEGGNAALAEMVDEDDLYETLLFWVVSQNSHRRHLSVQQLAIIAGKVANELEEARKRQAEREREQNDEEKSVANLQQGRVNEIAAAQVGGVSPRTVADAQDLLRRDPQTAEDIVGGKKGAPSVSAAKRKLPKKEPLKQESRRDVFLPDLKVGDEVVVASGSGEDYQSKSKDWQRTINVVKAINDRWITLNNVGYSDFESKQDFHRKSGKNTSPHSGGILRMATAEDKRTLPVVADLMRDIKESARVLKALPQLTKSHIHIDINNHVLVHLDIRNLPINQLFWIRDSLKAAPAVHETGPTKKRLTPEQRQEIVALLKENRLTQAEIAKRYGVSQGTISNIGMAAA